MLSLADLIHELDELQAALEARVAESGAVLAGIPEPVSECAVNLIRYTELRGHDVREVQSDLMDLGVTSLAVAEPDVAAKIQAARNALGALAGESGPWDLKSVDDALDRGEAVLEQRAADLLGARHEGRKTRIMVTLPSEAASDDQLVHDLAVAGMDLARINCAHDGPDEWERMAANVRAAGASVGRKIKVYMDLAGPKLRTGPLEPGPGVVRARVTRDATGQTVVPARVWFTGADRPVAPPDLGDRPGVRPVAVVPVDAGWIGRRAEGDSLRVQDARGRSRTLSVSRVGDGALLAECERGMFLTAGCTVSCGDDRTDVGPLPPVEQKLRLFTGDVLQLSRDLTPAPVERLPPRIGCTLPEAFKAVRPGHRVLLDDGVIVGVVEAVEPDLLTLRLTHAKPGGQNLAGEKGINLPDTDLPLTALTSEDETNLDHAVGLADIIGLSFVREPADVALLRDRLAARGADSLGLVVKIETERAFARLPEILLDLLRWPTVGVMIARGDLAVEVGWERMSEVPDQILSMCEAARVPTIWATQVLDTLAKQGQPSRAEITDAAAAVRAECVMLNKGPHIIDAIVALDHILRRMVQVQRKSQLLLRPISSWSRPAPAPARQARHGAP